jgi:hypothetical protein
MKFRASVELSGKTATGIEVPAAVVTLQRAELGSDDLEFVPLGFECPLKPSRQRAIAPGLAPESLWMRFGRGAENFTAAPRASIFGR